MPNVTVIELHLPEDVLKSADINNILNRAEGMCRRMAAEGKKLSSDTQPGIVVSEYHLDEGKGKPLRRFDSNGGTEVWSETSFGFLPA